MWILFIHLTKWFTETENPTVGAKLLFPRRFWEQFMKDSTGKPKVSSIRCRCKWHKN